MRFFCLSFAVFAVGLAHPALAGTVMMQDMTWQEIAADVRDGYTTVIVPTGGTEQNGPHIVTGKHNYILERTAPAIAGELGHTLVAPILPYVPEGNISPPAGHMKFPGTFSLRPETFASVLEDTAGSLRQHGFKLICFVGEHGASQPVQEEVAKKLSAKWKDEGVKVIQVNEYYDGHNGQLAWIEKENPKINPQDVEAHGGLADTSEMLAAHPEGVREKLRAAFTPQDYNTLGADGSAMDASTEYGKKFLELKIEGAVRQIERERGSK